MANIFDKFLNSMRLYDDEDLEDDEEYLDDEPEEEEELPPARPERPEKPEKTERERPEKAERAPKKTRQPAPEEEEEPLPRAAARPARRSNVTSMRQMPSRVSTVMEVSMVKPTDMEDARDICDMLLSGRAVVINMEGVQVDLAQRIIDFASGACYSIEGNIQKISSYIFIVSPSSIELSGDFQNVLNAAGGSGLRLDDRN